MRAPPNLRRPRPAPGAAGSLQTNLLWLLGLCAVLLLLAFWWQPALVRGLALHAPSAAGFSEIDGDLWVEREAPDADAGRLAAAAAGARDVVQRFFGGEPARAVVLACGTPECFARFGGTDRAAATLPGGRVLLAPDGVDAALLANALAHVELEARIGTIRTWWAVPRWFTEGLAALVSDDPQFRGAMRAGAGPDAPTLEDLATESGWRDADPALAYATAREEVERWYARAGRGGLDELVDALRSGESFDSAYAEARRQER